jgi:hypothetical protein
MWAWRLDISDENGWKQGNDNVEAKGNFFINTILDCLRSRSPNYTILSPSIFV